MMHRRPIWLSLSALLALAFLLALISMLPSTAHPQNASAQTYVGSCSNGATLYYGQTCPSGSSGIYCPTLGTLVASYCPTSYSSACAVYSLGCSACAYGATSYYTTGCGTSACGYGYSTLGCSSYGCGSSYYSGYSGYSGSCSSGGVTLCNGQVTYSSACSQTGAAGVRYCASTSGSPYPQPCAGSTTSTAAPYGSTSTSTAATQPAASTQLVTCPTTGAQVPSSSQCPTTCPNGQIEPPGQTCPSGSSTTASTSGTSSTAAASGSGITLKDGWNLIGGPTGATVTGGGSLYTYQAGDSSYETIAPGTPLKGGQGYWVNVSGGASLALPAGASGSATVQLPAGQYVMIGNPDTTPATVSGADSVLVYDPAAGSYSQTTTLPAGAGAWALSNAGGQATIGSGS